jgi:hypothetical protein
MHCLESPIPTRGVVIRESYRELRDSTRQTFMEWFADITEWKEADQVAVVTLPSKFGKNLKHELYFRSAQRPEDVQKFQSTEFSWAWLEEICPAWQSSGTMGAGLPKAVLDIIAMRLRQKGAHRYGIVCTMNPPTPSHWAYKEFILPSKEELAAKNYSVHWQPPRENEHNLRPGYYDTLTARLDDDQKRRFVGGEVVAFYDGERVFPEFTEQFNVVDDIIDPIPGIDLVLGFDFGLTPATLVTQITSHGQWRWLRELQSFNSGIDSHMEYLRSVLNEYYPGYSFRSWADPAGNAKSQTDEKTCYDIMRSKGFPVNPGARDWQTRKEAIKQRLERQLNGKPALVVSRTGCPLATEAMLGAYRYPKARDGRIGAHPIKNDFSHLMDAAQYIASAEFKILESVDARRHGPTLTGRAALPKFNPLASPRRPAAAKRRGWMAR